MQIANFDTQLVNSYLERRDYDKIIGNKNLFLTTFYKMYKNENLNPIIKFKVTVLENAIKIKGDPGAISQVTECIEKIRQLLLDSKKEQSLLVNILIIKHCGEVFFVKENPLIDVSKFGVKGISGRFYKSLILTNLQGLAKACGFVFFETTQSQIIKGYITTGTIKIKVLHFEWSKEEYITYPILPKAIKELENFGVGFYKMYQEQTICDFKLCTQDKGGKIFQVHSTILHLNGGPVLQKMVTGLFKEGQERSISFQDYSAHTIAGFIKFIYLGAKAFVDQYVSCLSGDADIFELLRFAHAFQVSVLIDCCTNIISLLAKKENKEDIKVLANTYGNEHLKQLYQYLNKIAEIHA